MSDACTMITVAPTGAELDPASHPALPVTLEALVHDAMDCQAAGASMIHVHLRDAQSRSTLGPGRRARDNAELVQRAARPAEEAQRRAATPAQARALLGLTTGRAA